MTAVTIPGQTLYWPPPRLDSAGVNTAASTAINAATDKTAFFGQLYIDGRPTSSKTISAAGGGSISFRTAGVTWANAGTNVDIGIQGVSAVAGPPQRPDGVFTVKASCVPGTTAINANAWNTIAMTTGTATLSHGDIIAVVFDMTALGGADSVVHTGTTLSSNSAFPSANEFQAGAWATTTRSYGPNVLITFDDGTIATLADTFPFTTLVADSWNTGSAADEHGIWFQVPFDCTVNGLYAFLGRASASGDGTLKLYSTPFGTPSLLASATFDGNHSLATNVLGGFRYWAAILNTPVTLTANTDYVVSFLSTSATSIAMPLLTVAAAAHFNLYPGGPDIGLTTRDNSTGAFAAASTTTTYPIGVLIDSISGFGGGGGGGIKLAGRGGLAG